MATLGGMHLQAHTGRELTCWCAFEVVGKTDLSYVATISDGLALLSQHEKTLRYDPFGVPAAAIVQMNVCKHIEQTSFGEGKLAVRR